MNTYLKMLKKVLEEGEVRKDRTDTGTLSIFSHQMDFDLTKGFPLMTTKRLHLPSIIYELLWFIRGDTNVRYLNENGVRIWDEWADDEGNLGRIYGAQWRDWRTSNGETRDQLLNLVEGLKKDIYSRRHILSAWNPGELDKMSLPPCHLLIQLYVDKEKGLHCQMYQRSADIFLGVPFNIASYALLTHMIAKVTNLIPKRLIWLGGDVHLYKNHIEQARKQLTREPRPLPQIKLADCSSIFDFNYESIEIVNYDPYEKITADISV